MVCSSFCLATMGDEYRFMDTETTRCAFLALVFFFLHLYLANELIYYYSVLIHFLVHLVPLLPFTIHSLVMMMRMVVMIITRFCYKMQSSVHFLSYFFLFVCRCVASSFPLLLLV